MRLDQLSLCSYNTKVIYKLTDESWLSRVLKDTRTLLTIVKRRQKNVVKYDATMK